MCQGYLRDTQSLVFEYFGYSVHVCMCMCLCMCVHDVYVCICVVCACVYGVCTCACVCKCVCVVCGVHMYSVCANTCMWRPENNFQCHHLFWGCLSVAWSLLTRLGWWPLGTRATPACASPVSGSNMCPTTLSFCIGAGDWTLTLVFASPQTLVVWFSKCKREC